MVWRTQELICLCFILVWRGENWNHRQKWVWIPVLELWWGEEDCYQPRLKVQDSNTANLGDLYQQQLGGSLQPQQRSYEVLQRWKQVYDMRTRTCESFDSLSKEYLARDLVWCWCSDSNFITTPTHPAPPGRRPALLWTTEERPEMLPLWWRKRTQMRRKPLIL